VVDDSLTLTLPVPPSGNILAIDPGTKCGWAAKAGAIYSGVWDLAPKRFEGGGMRYVRFHKYLAEIIDSLHIGQVYFEEVRRHLGTDAAHIYGGIVSHLTAFCEERGIPYSGIPVGTIKKLATGKGNAGKLEMIVAAKALFPGTVPKDDNEADALCILYAAEKA